MQIVAGPELTTAQLYEILRLRDVVFNFEQRCDDIEIDGTDLRTDCVHLWFSDENGLATSYLRTYVTGEARKVGRVCTRRDRRGRGLSTSLMRAVHERWGGEPIRLDAQAYLAGWYEGLGYDVIGPNYVEAGIDHVPMLRNPNPRSPNPVR